MICEPLGGQPISEYIKRNWYLELADFAEGSSILAVDIFIGSHYYWELVMEEFGEGRIDLWESTQSLVGCCLVQQTQWWWPLLHQPYNYSFTPSRHPTWQDIWGASDPRDPWARQDNLWWFLRVHITFNSRDTNQMSILWRQQHKPLPENCQLSLHQLVGLLKRPRQVPDILQKYDGTIQEQI